jgi:hypothetical protein
MINQEVNGNKILYHIRVKGHLDQKWADWFDGFVITSRADGETLMSGSVVDQAALHGVLDKIHGLGLPLLLLAQTECPCSSKKCVRRGNCQECAAHYRESGGLPFCLREKSGWNKQCMKLR